jgi:glucan biosynthesis protein C
MGSVALFLHTRRYELDWLRVLAILAVFLYHCSRFWDLYPWHVKDAVTSPALHAVGSFFIQWGMPLFFVISGAAVFFALGTRPAWRFVRDRVLRLAVPLVFGVFILSPPQIYLERLTHGQFSGTLFQWLPHFFDGIYEAGGNFPLSGVHLWFLVFLLIYTLLALPLTVPGRTKKGSPLARLGRLVRRPWTILLLWIPLALVDTFCDPEIAIRVAGGWNVISYFLFFMLGYMVYSDEEARDVPRKLFVPLLIAGACLTTLGYLLQYGFRIEAEYGTSTWAGIQVLRGARAWFWILAILGMGDRYLNRTNRFLAYANTGVLPFYILHQPIILLIGYFVVQWHATIAAKYLFITATSFAAVMLVYEFLIRRIPPVCYIFGIGRKKRPQTAQPAS